MTEKNCFKFVLLLIFLKCQGLYCQISACNLSTIDHSSNVCDNSNYLVYINEIACGANRGINCWCILVDNRNRAYNGKNVEIAMDHEFRITWSRAQRIDSGNNSLEIKFSITPGVNQILVQPFALSSPVPKLISFKIDNQNICNTVNRRKKQIFPQPYEDNDYIDPSSAKVQVVPQTHQTPNTQKDDYRFLNDCIKRSTYSPNSERFCRIEDGNNFLIEKRYFSREERYWCISVNNDKNVFRKTNRLKISYTNQNKFLAWIPSDSYIQQNSAESNFHLGNRRTIIAVSVNTGDLPDLNAVTIDGQSICNYFQPPASAPPPTPPTRPSTTPMYIRPPQPVTDRVPIVPQTQAPQQEIQQQEIQQQEAPQQEVQQQAAPQQEAQRPIEQQNAPSFNKNCGIKPAKRVTLISYGSNTNAGDWPWHAAIYKLQSKTNRNYICGGTLIDRKTIITAAHCVLDLNLVIIPDRIIVELGRHDLSISTPATQEFKVFDVIPHESYNPETIENDIAILTLANYVQLTTYVSFVCLPEPNLNLQKQVGRTVGWGRDQNNQLQTELKEAAMPVIDNIVCLSSNREFFGQYLTNTNFCAGYRNNTNVCRGDSGGGLVFKFGKQWVLGGITSLGVSSKSTELECDISQYAIFTDVTKFVKWIKRNS